MSSGDTKRITQPSAVSSFIAARQFSICCSRMRGFFVHLFGGISSDEHTSARFTSATPDVKPSHMFSNDSSRSDSYSGEQRRGAARRASQRVFRE